MAKDITDIKWLNEPEEHDYPAALSYLRLLYEDNLANAYVEKLRQAPISQFKAKDIFRASGLSLLGTSNSHVEKDQKKIESGKELSPLLLVRDSTQSKLIIADGYHRLCAVYSFDEDAIIPCKIV
jgi:hypothetical protein